GSGFEFMNFDKLNSNSFFNNANGLERAPLSHHTYGGTLGGPILKDKLFFFGSYEKLRDRRSSNVNYAVPTDKMRNGDFSEVAAAFPQFITDPNNPNNRILNPNRFQLYNPNTGGAVGVGRTQFDNFMIPNGMISPIAKAVMNFYPKVN